MKHVPDIPKMGRKTTDNVIIPVAAPARSAAYTPGADFETSEKLSLVAETYINPMTEEGSRIISSIDIHEKPVTLTF